MRNGTYRKRQINFKKFETERFVPFLFEFATYAGFGCGVTTLALLTGVSPVAIYKRLGDGHVSDDRMVHFLRAYGFSVAEVTKADVSFNQFYNDYIKSTHVLLFSQLLLRGEATWAVIHDSCIFHNFETRRIKSLEFLNRPLLTVYLVWHPLYKNGRKSINKLCYDY